MTGNSVNHESPKKENQLLNPEEQAMLNLVATREPPHSQRAQALLAINEGATQAEAGVQAGLTRNQVRYWLTKFRKDRTGIFPEELLIQAQQVEAEPPQSSAKQAASPEMPDLDQPMDEEGAQQGLLDEKETVGPVDAAKAQLEDTPQAKKKSKKKPKKKAKKAKKSVKKKKQKKDKKVLKGKKSKKKNKKGKSKKAKVKKSKPSKKKRKK